MRRGEGLHLRDDAVEGDDVHHGAHHHQDRAENELKEHRNPLLWPDGAGQD